MAEALKFHAVVAGQDAASAGCMACRGRSCVAIGARKRPQQMAELRAISTRAEISPTRFWNVSAAVPAFARRFEALRKRKLRRRFLFERWKRANQSDSGER